MNIDQLKMVLARQADRLDEQHTVMSIDLEKDEEGFILPSPPSDLKDALQIMTETVSVLSRVVAELERNGIE